MRIMMLMTMSTMLPLVKTLTQVSRKPEAGNQVLSDQDSVMMTRNTKK